MRQTEYRQMFEVEETHWWFVGLHELVLHYLERETLARGRKLEVFDAGCGTGRLLQLMSASASVEGCDSSETALRYCGKRGLSGIEAGDLNDIRLPCGRYDVITSMDVLSHENVRDDGAILEKFRSALREGGLLLLNLPAWNALRSPHDLAVLTRERYRKKTLAGRLRRAGFEIEFITYRLFFLFPFVALYRLGRETFRRLSPGAEVSSDVAMPPDRLNRMLTGILRLENRILRLISLPVGTSLFAAARKRGA